jgi:hypothetical protein
MTEPQITQADRIAAAAITVLPEMRDLILAGKADHHAEPFARHVAAERAEIARLTAELAKANSPTWFYHPDYTETCQFSPWDVIDYYDMDAGSHVLEVECARSLPSIWCAVTIRTTEEMDALETDDRVVIAEYATEAEARAALALAEPKP